MPKASDTYFQFPLCLLAYGKDVHTRLNDLISFCCVDTGKIIANQTPQGERLIVADEKASRMGHKFKDYERENKNQVAALLGADLLKVEFPDVEIIVNEWECADVHRLHFEKAYGFDVKVRIATSFLWDTIKNSGMSYREFSVLCAIYSCIGSKNHPVRITREMIQSRQLGYKSHRIKEMELPARADGMRSLSLRQIGYTVDALHERGFFSRARANQRQTYYSNRLTQQELEERLVRSKTFSKRFHQIRRDNDRALMERIKQQNVKL
jgi:hypothetical protein